MGSDDVFSVVALLLPQEETIIGVVHIAIINMLYLNIYSIPF